MEKLQYRKGQDDERFARFRPDALVNWPIDLMFVDDQTFQKLMDQSIEAAFGSAGVRVVSARHLAIMKIHALKTFQQHRFVKDYNDLIALLRSGRTGITSDELKELCHRYATPGLFKKLQKELSGW